VIPLLGIFGGDDDDHRITPEEAGGIFGKGWGGSNPWEEAGESSEPGKGPMSDEEYRRRGEAWGEHLLQTGKTNWGQWGSRQQWGPPGKGATCLLPVLLPLAATVAAVFHVKRRETGQR
jgi:hypothetical protein